MPKRRILLLHYHLFKNAGTSVDEMLRKNFGARWINREFSVPRRDNARAVATFIHANPDIEAISSHTALLPAPQIEGADVFPVIFIRHPIDRLRSAYEFERGQNADTFGARLAKVHDFAGYVATLLQKRNSRQARNFQAFRLAQNTTGRGSERERTIRAMGDLPFIGLVEEFDDSVDCLARMLCPIIPHFTAIKRRVNVQLRECSLEARLARARSALGTTLYDELCSANDLDLMIFNILRESFAKRHSGAPPFFAL